jgi:hypothetical protein
LRRGVKIPVDYIFDESGDSGMEAQMWYPAMKATAHPEVASLMGSTPEFRKDEDMLPLQAADLVAWHKRRQKVKLGRDTETVATQRVDELPGCERHIPRDALEGLAEKISRVPCVEQFRDGLSIYQQMKLANRKAGGK